jgi:hypothetical protein
LVLHLFLEHRISCTCYNSYTRCVNFLVPSCTITFVVFGLKHTRISSSSQCSTIGSIITLKLAPGSGHVVHIDGLLKKRRWPELLRLHGLYTSGDSECTMGCMFQLCANTGSTTRLVEEARGPDLVWRWCILKNSRYKGTMSLQRPGRSLADQHFSSDLGTGRLNQVLGVYSS